MPQCNILRLVASYQGVSDAGAIALANAFKTSSIMELDLRHNSLMAFSGWRYGRMVSPLQVQGCLYVCVLVCRCMRCVHSLLGMFGPHAH